MRALPIRLRLTLPFAVGMALLVAAIGYFIYMRVGGELLRTVDQSLTVQLAEAEQHLKEGDSGPLLDPDVNEGPRIAQVVLPNGTVASSSAPSIGPLLHGNQLRDALTRPLRTTQDVRGLRGDWRLATQPVGYHGGTAVLVAGRSLAARKDTLERLGNEFLFAAPVVAVLTILAGYLLTAGALRPVEAMRRRAAAITAETPGQRLPVPPARDELSALAVTLNEMLERLEDALRRERDFVADAGHELRTPLALLRTELELALRHGVSPDELRDAIAASALEVDRLAQLAEDLLLIARSERGELPLRLETLDAEAVLAGVESRFAWRAEAADRPLGHESPPGLLVRADRVRLEQALGNLVDNALRYGDGRIRLRAASVNGRVELHVEDEGRGFPPAFLAHAFERFSRADSARERGGAGLGLSIVRTIAEAHGGSADAANGAGGADVWLAVPKG